MNTDQLSVRAIRTHQGQVDIYTFFLQGPRLLEIGEISRLGQSDGGKITGFQRPEIRTHVRNITEYLNRGSVLFPNAIILALSPGVHFHTTRGPKPRGVDPASEAGTLSIPIHTNRKAGWIVDGQQRTLALGQTCNRDLMVPIVAFISDELSEHREQFILVNKAKPLSPRLIDELLPEVGAILSRNLSARRAPSELCNTLNTQTSSPFYGLIRRPSSNDTPNSVVMDSSLIKVIRRSIQDPRGSLAACVSTDGSADLDTMFRLMVTYWSAVKEAFPEAWGLPPHRSRLMHAAGLEAMGVLMDQVMTRYEEPYDKCYATVRTILEQLAPRCRWTSGRWQSLDRAWNDIQCTSKDVRALSNFLVTTEREISRCMVTT